MTSHRAKSLYTKYCGLVAYVAVRTSSGDSGIGSAFHVGEGVFVTARHVVENMEITEVGVAAPGGYNMLGDPNGPFRLKLSSPPVFHADSSLDVAAFQVKGVDRMPYVPLGPFPGGWMTEGDWVMSDALIFGYPPIPNTSEPHLVVSQAQVNALVRLRDNSRRHFILSATARGGFSGGLALSESDFALGLITSSLESKQVIADETIQEPGYMAVLSLRPVFECLFAADLLPKCQEPQWTDFPDFPDALAMQLLPGSELIGVPVSSIYVRNDPKHLYLDIVMHSSSPSTTDLVSQERLREVLTAVTETVRVELRAAVGVTPIESGSASNITFHIEGRSKENRQAVEKARHLALQEFSALGFRVSLSKPDY
jgi:hypothetical protein